MQRAKSRSGTSAPLGGRSIENPGGRVVTDEPARAAVQPNPQAGTQTIRQADARLTERSI
jgi:hypothetical protein